jgi:transposase-like protein
MHSAFEITTDPEVWIARGDACQDEGRDFEALACFRTASRLAPLDVEAATSAGNCLAELGRWSEAAVSYGEALRNEPDDVDLQRMHADAESTAAGYRVASAGTGVAVLAVGGAVAARCTAPGAVAWAASAVAPMLRAQHYATVDGFCERLGVDTSALRSWLRELRNDGALLPGEVDREMARSTRGDLITSVSVRGGRMERTAAAGLGRREQPAALEELLLALDSLVRALQLAPALRGIIPPSLLREERQIQATLYPHGSSGYERHTDDPSGEDGRVLTCIVYFNEGWTEGDGGELRLHLDHERRSGDAGGGGAGGAAAADSDSDSDSDWTDVSPLGGRLVVFWSDGRVPHSVRAVMADRFALSVWYTDASIVGIVAAGV